MRAERLAGRMFFSHLRRSGSLIFAEMPVAADSTHYVALDTSTHRLYCSCPFQPKPCVHAEALQLLVVRAGEEIEFKEEELPEWLPANLALTAESVSRKQGVSNSSELAGGKQQPADFQPTGLPTGEEQPANLFPRAEPLGGKQDASNSSGRADGKQQPADFQPTGLPAGEYAAPTALERAQSGFEDLEIWLLDTLRRGVATAVSEDPDFYKNIAVRLADASMRGLSRSMRLLETLPADRSDWPEYTTAVLAETALALHGFRRRNQLPPVLLRDLEAVVGLAPKKDVVRAEGESLHDAWAVLGVVEEPVEERLRQRRTWLLGAGSGRYALLLDYAFGVPDFMPGFKPGSVLEGELVFYPSAWPCRALASESIKTLPQTLENLPGYEKIEDMARTCAAALGQQPWLQAFPAVLQHVTPFFHKNQFGIADLEGKQLPLANPATVCWPLVALGGGKPISIFGEWNGKTLTAFSALADERFVAL